MKYRIFLFALLAVVFTSCNSGQASVEQKQKVECSDVNHDVHNHADGEVSTKSATNTAGITSGHDCGNCSEKATCSDVVPSKIKDQDQTANHKSADSESYESTPCTGHDH
jgi:PBP1b-binding outer membrane lipoprotein LpoB